MSTTLHPIEPESGSARAVQNAVTALELNRDRLNALLDEPEHSDASPLASTGLGLLVRSLSGVQDIGETLRPIAAKHPYRILAAGAAVGGLAYFALPRLAVGLVVPVLWSEGRQLVHDVLHGWLRSGGARRRTRGQA